VGASGKIVGMQATYDNNRYVRGEIWLDGLACQADYITLVIAEVAGYVVG
jgi:hypothetical protein